MPSMRTERTTPPRARQQAELDLGEAELGPSGRRRRSRWWQASAISRPPPSAAPLIAATTGLPSVSSRRSCALSSRTMPRDLGGVLACVAFLRSLRSPPAKNVFLARGDDDAGDRVLLGLQAVDGRGHRGARRPRSSCWRDWFGSSRVRMTTPSSSCSQRIVSRRPSDRAPRRSRCPCRRRRTAWRGRSGRRCARARRSSVPRIMPPVAPSGWPMAIAPPLTLTFSMSRSMSLTKRSTTAANASLISTGRGRRPSGRPWRAPCVEAGAGPVSMIVGSAPETAVARIRARGFRPSSSPVCSLPIASSDGAVDDAGRVARRVDVVDLLDPVVLLQRDGVEAAHARPSSRTTA